MSTRYSAIGTACATTSGFAFYQLNASANAGLVVREIHCFNESTNTALIRIMRLTTTAPTGTALTENAHNTDIGNATAEGVAVKSVTTGPTLGAELDIGVVGAAV